MTRGTGATSNKFRKYIGAQCLILEVGTAAHQYTVERLASGDCPEDWSQEEIDEILSASGYEMPKEEVQVAVEPNAKRGPGRPRKVSVETDTTGAVYPEGLE